MEAASFFLEKFRRKSWCEVQNCRLVICLFHLGENRVLNSLIIIFSAVKDPIGLKYLFYYEEYFYIDRIAGNVAITIHFQCTTNCRRLEPHCSDL
jgi:hypothetical protein